MTSKKKKKTIQNGFRTCGLMHFYPNAVEYNILNKSNKNTNNSVENENCESLMNEQLFTGKTIQDKENYLEMFEIEYFIYNLILCKKNLNKLHPFLYFIHDTR